MLPQDPFPGRQRPPVVRPVGVLLRLGQDLERRQQRDVSQVELGHGELGGDSLGLSPRRSVDCHRHLLVS
jgi:hypothetical protein